MNTKQLKHSALALAIGAGLTAGHAHGQLAVAESFDYATGNVGGQNGGTGFTAAWSATKNNPTVAFPDKLWGALDNAGGYSRGGAWSGVIRPIGTTLLDANLLNNGATLWFSVVFDLDGQNASNADISVALCNADKFDSATFANRENLVPSTAEGIGVTHSGAVVQGVYWTNDNLRTELSSSLNIGLGRALIVGKIDWGATALDAETITLYAPGLDLSLGTPILAATATAPLDQTTFNQIAIQYKDTSQVDEIRFGATSADVLPVSTTAPALAPADIVDDQGGGPIGEDIAVITYTLSFNVPMDIGTITAADFDNAGTATATIGAVTQPDQTTIKVQVLPTTTGTVQLRIPATSVLSGYNGLNLDTTLAILDDTTITINAGPTTDTGNRYWDGGSVDLTGPTDGVSQGGSGTWNTTTLNWDPGAGFADPVAWNNTNLDTAILGGANGTISLGTGITAGGITSSSAYTISGANTLTLDVASGTPVVNVTANTLTISSQISGSDGLQKNGGGILVLTGANDFSGGVTLNAGTLYTGSNANAFGVGTLTINGGRIDPSSGGAGTTVTTTNANTWNASWTMGRGTTGTATWNNNGNILLGGNVTVSSANNFTNLNLGGVISDGGTNRSLTFSVSGTTLSNANTYGGGTTTSVLLKINNGGSGGTSSAIGTGTLTISGGTIDNTSGGSITLSTNNVQAWNGNFTFTGSNDLNMGTGAVTMNANRTVTVTAGTLTVGGAIGTGSQTLTKAGAGTLALAGANTYTGNTTVSAGTLALVGGSQDSAITVNSGAFLGFTLGSPTTSTKALTLNTGHAIRITGTPTLASYTLITALSIGGTGTPTLESPIIGYELVVDGTALKLNSTGASSPYDTWANSFLPGADVSDPTLDFDSDTLSNLREFAFGTDPTVNFTGPMVYVAGGDVTTPGQPVLLEEGGTYYAVFARRKDHVAAGLTYTVQFSADLSSPWVASVDVPTLVTSDPSAGDIEAVRVPFPGLIPTDSGPQKATFFRVELELAP